MDVIEFRLTHKRYGPNKFLLPAADIFINGQDLLMKVENFYPGTYSSMKTHDLYNNLTEEYKDDSVYVYCCSCGYECSCALVNIDVGVNTI